MGLFSIFAHQRLRRSNYPEAATSLISTLNAVDTHPQLYLNKQVLHRAIHRYEHVWIPLLTRVPPDDRVKLVPPLDVEWVWICHMLAPHIYAIDSAAIWEANVSSERGYVVDHAVLDARARQLGLARAKTLWKASFPNEPFDILDEIDTAALVTDTTSTSSPRDAEPAVYAESRITYDIIAAAERQMAFHYQVAITPHYRHKGFLTFAAARYKNFLRLFEKSKRQRFSPTYDIDLMWHTHQLHPRLYAQKTKKVAGRLIPHDDTLNDRTEGAELLQVWDATKTRWSEKYGNSICQRGCMFRGNVTAAERLLRSRLEDDASDFAAGLPCRDSKGYSNMTMTPPRESAAEPPPPGGVEWVHLTDVAKAVKAGGDVAVRTSKLTIADTDMGLEARVTNVAAEKHLDIHSAIELFDARHAQSADALPLASAHVAPAGSVVLHEPGSKFRPLRDQGETIVLRVAGRDVALLAGCWLGYTVPVAGAKGIPGDKDSRRRGVPGKKDVLGRPGALSLAITFLGERSRWTALVSEYAQDGRTPPTFAIRGSGTIRMRVDVAAGLVQFRDQEDALLAGIVGMGAALLHVRLQPRVRPDADGDGRSIYPKWMVQQHKYAALTATGGEMRRGERLVGYGQMLANAAAQRKTPRATKVWQGTQAHVTAWDRGLVGTRKDDISFDDGLNFGYVSGYAWFGDGNDKPDDDKVARILMEEEKGAAGVVSAAGAAEEEVVTAAGAYDEGWVCDR